MMLRFDQGLQAAALRLAMSYERLQRFEEIDAIPILKRHERRLLKKRLKAFREELAKSRGRDPYDQPLAVEDKPMAVVIPRP